jgi:enoyl-CoA hydratase
MKVETKNEGPILVVSINRPEARNAVDRETAELLYEAFAGFDADGDLKVAVLHGAGGHFSAGADLKALSAGVANRLEPEGSAPLGPTRLRLKKPVIAAVSGYAVAGGLELAIWCDLRIAEKGSVFGVFCRRWGVPLIDGGTVRLARIVGFGRALDMLLTGRPVEAEEALSMGLANRVVPDGKALEAAMELASAIAAHPQTCMRNDRLSMYESFDLPYEAAMKNEFLRGMDSIASAELVEGIGRYSSGEGRHGRF